MEEKPRKEYTHRHAVVKWYPWWQDAIKNQYQGNWEYAIDLLRQGKTKFLTRKDRLGMIQRILDGVDAHEF